MEPTDLTNLTELAAEIVSAYVSKNSVSNADLQTLIANVHRALQAIQTGETVSLDKPEQKPAVPIKKSLTPDYLVSLEDGARYKSLKRHLATKYGLTPQAYREKMGTTQQLPDGRAQLRSCVIRDGEEQRPRPEAKGSPGETVEKGESRLSRSKRGGGQ